MLWDVLHNSYIYAVAALVLGWFVVRRGQILSDRAKNSHNYPMLIYDTKHAGSLKTVVRLIEAVRVYPPDGQTDADRRAQQAVDNILAYYEKIAIDIDAGYLSYKYHFKQFKNFTERFFILSSDYISREREKASTSTYYKNYESLFIRQYFWPMPRSLSIIEFLGVCPRMSLGASVFAAHLKTKNGRTSDFLRQCLRYNKLPSKIHYIHDLTRTRREFRRRIFIIRRIEMLIIFLLISLAVFVFLAPMPARLKGSNSRYLYSKRA